MQGRTIGLILLMVSACSVESETDDDPSLTGRVEQDLITDDGGTVTIQKFLFGAEPPNALSTAEYLTSSSDDFVPGLFALDPVTRRIVVSGIRSRVLRYLPIGRCERFDGSLPLPPVPTTTAKDVGAFVRVTAPSFEFELSKSVIGTHIFYAGEALDAAQVPDNTTYRVHLDGRPGLDTRGYEGSRISFRSVPNVTQPVIGESATLDLTRALPLRWTPTGATSIQIQIGGFDNASVMCSVPDSGHFTIPASKLSGIGSDGFLALSGVSRSFAVLEGRTVLHIGFAGRLAFYSAP